MIDGGQALTDELVAIGVLAHEIDRRFRTATLQLLEDLESIARIDLRQEEEVTEQDEVAFADLIEREVVITPGAARNAHDDGERRRRGLHHDARRVESAALKLRNGETPVIIVPDRAESGDGNTGIEDVDIAAGIRHKTARNPRERTDLRELARLRISADLVDLVDENRPGCNDLSHVSWPRRSTDPRAPSGRRACPGGSGCRTR